MLKNNHALNMIINNNLAPQLICKLPRHFAGDRKMTAINQSDTFHHYYPLTDIYLVIYPIDFMGQLFRYYSTGIRYSAYTSKCRKPKSAGT